MSVDLLFPGNAKVVGRLRGWNAAIGLISEHGLLFRHDYEAMRLAVVIDGTDMHAHVVQRWFCVQFNTTDSFVLSKHDRYASLDMANLKMLVEVCQGRIAFIADESLGNWQVMLGRGIYFESEADAVLFNIAWKKLHDILGFQMRFYSTAILVAARIMQEY